MIDKVNFSNVEPSLFIEVNVTTIISRNYICNLAFSYYFSFEVFLRLLFYFSYLIPSIDLINRISKFNFPMNPLIKRAHNSVVEGVRWIIKFDCLTVCEYYSFVASWSADSWVEVCFDAILVPTKHCVLLVGTFNMKRRSWRMMASLLTEHFSTICSIGLISFSKNRIKWLFKWRIFP